MMKSIWTLMMEIFFLTDESLEGILDFGTFKSTPCTVVSFQEKHSLTDLDPSAVLRSSEVPDPSDKWEDVDLDSFCVFDEMPLEFFDQDVMFSSPIGFIGSSIDIVDMLKIFLGDIPDLNTYFLQSHLIVMMQLLFVLS